MEHDMVAIRDFYKYKVLVSIIMNTINKALSMVKISLMLCINALYMLRILEGYNKFHIKLFQAGQYLKGKATKL